LTYALFTSEVPAQPELLYSTDAATAKAGEERKSIDLDQIGVTAPNINYELWAGHHPRSKSGGGIHL
jgi:hypothetical protein